MPNVGQESERNIKHKYSQEQGKKRKVYTKLQKHELTVDFHTCWAYTGILVMIIKTLHHTQVLLSLGYVYT
jgi:hypothetical protein